MSGLGEALVLLGALLAFGGSVGLVRLKTFYERVHPPTMGTTLGTALVVAGSMIHFGTVHEVLIGLFITVTTPISYILLVGAARRRHRSR
ncbi:MAG TPA: monovalent cation/H(+) antiporter subunit G [Burkholderiales bacterium]|jgi:multicomponent K+:H+ antiporter subunit G|nr:monovalent cation/H(+) antiporter subunit G [Burkholderiales bacterium]